ncbi:MAG TPA: VOC family protein [Arachnia sp.]|nr:VOC family protein [Arachnia sp.]HMT86450.1 VOC family protein [Arachnia sp.]
MFVDHLIFATGPNGLQADAERLAGVLGTEYKNGGFHPRFGTRNHIIPLAGHRYVEVVEVLDHPAAEQAMFGKAVRARSELGGGWMGWVIGVDDIAPYEKRLGRPSVPGTRQFPDGRRLDWVQIGIKGLMADPQLPYFLQWKSDASLLPAALPGTVELKEIEISGSAERLSEWLAQPVGDSIDGVALKLVSPNGQPGINNVTFDTPRGIVTI